MKVYEPALVCMRGHIINHRSLSNVLYAMWKSFSFGN